MHNRGSGEVVVRDSRPMQAVPVLMIASGGAVIAYWAIRRPLIGVPLLLMLIGLLLVPSRASNNITVASSQGIAGLRVRIPRNERSRLRRYEVVRLVTPWDQIESVSVASSVLGSRVRVRLTDGREADLAATAVTRRGLRKISDELERLRPAAA